MNKKKKLTERQAWLEIARRIAEGDWRERGLCREVDVLGDDYEIETAVWVAMHSRVRGHMDAMETWSLYLDRPGYADPRVLAALLLAEESR